MSAAQGAHRLDAHRAPGPANAEPRVVSPGYFEAMGIELVLGRSLDRHGWSGANMIGNTTLNVYTQVLDGALRAAVDKVGGELFAIVHEPEGRAAGMRCGADVRSAFALGASARQLSRERPDRRGVGAREWIRCVYP